MPGSPEGNTEGPVAFCLLCPPAQHPRRNSRMPPQLEKNHVVPTAWQDDCRDQEGRRGLRGSGAGTLGVPLEGTRRIGELFRQGSQVSMRVARGSASWLSSHFRAKSPHLGLGPGRNVPLQGRPDRDRRGDSPAWSGRGSRPSRRTSGPGVSGDFWGSQEGCQGPSRPSGRNRGLPLRRRRGSRGGQRPRG